MHDLERGNEKILKFSGSQLVIFDFASLALVIHIVRLVSPDHIQLLAIQKPPCVSLACGIAAH